MDSLRAERDSSYGAALPSGEYQLLWIRRLAIANHLVIVVSTGQDLNEKIDYEAIHEPLAVRRNCQENGPPSGSGIGLDHCVTAEAATTTFPDVWAAVALGVDPPCWPSSYCLEC